MSFLQEQKTTPTIADEISNLFEQIILICDQEGLLGKELFAIDGCKMSSNASKDKFIRNDTNNGQRT